jgi:hypothetical protein
MIHSKAFFTLMLLLTTAILVAGCGGSSSGSDSTSVASTDTETEAGAGAGAETETETETETSGLHGAFAKFVGNVEVALDGDEVVIEATGRPNHTSAYWNPGNSSGLYVEPDTSITTVSQMSPGYIEEYTNLYTLRVPTNPSKASSATSTGLGAVGIAVSGVPIFNDEEGPAIQLSIGVISGFDRNGAHTGPETYHYHLEPKAITNDDAELVGIISDGFFLYGRQCFSTLGGYPEDLDDSGGHISMTEHSDGDEYHYHIQDEFYLDAYYVLFPGDYQGTPSNISN